MPAMRLEPPRRDTTRPVDTGPHSRVADQRQELERALKYPFDTRGRP
jgi:hypothetical protein